MDPSNFAGTLKNKNRSQPYSKINSGSKWLKNLKMKSKTLKVLDQDPRNYFCDIKDFLNNREKGKLFLIANRTLLPLQNHVQTHTEKDRGRKRQRKRELGTRI